MIHTTNRTDVRSGGCGGAQHEATDGPVWIRPVWIPPAAGGDRDRREGRVRSQSWTGSGSGCDASASGKSRMLAVQS
jgi:hypothetical protein